MKVGIVLRDASDTSVLGQWALALIRSASAKGWQAHLIAERANPGKMAGAGGETHLIAASRWGGAFGLWVFARRARRELKAEPLDLVIATAEFPDPEILLVPAPPDPGSAGKRLRSALKRRRFRLAVVAEEAAGRVLQESYGIPPEKLIVAGPPAAGASEQEWANRAESFWMSVA